MLLSVSSRVWNLIILAVVCFNIEGREGYEKGYIQSILNTKYKSLNNDDEKDGNSAIPDEIYNVTKHLSVNQRKVGKEHMHTPIWNVGIRRIKRNTPGNTVTDSYINGSQFLNIVPDNFLRQAFEYILKICSNIKICKHTVVSDYFPKGDHIRCCMQCDCSTTCHYRRSCCPTVEPVDKPEVVYYAASSCQYPVLFANLSKHNTYIEETAEFSFIRSCPQYSDTQTTILCEQPYIGPGYSMLDLLPVTDGDNMVNFANPHCAKCNHRTQNLHLWLPNIRCNKILEVSSIPEMEEEVRERDDCYIVIKPPTTLDVNSTRCFSNVINQCNITGQWSVYDTLLEKACDIIETLYTAALGTKTRYANIFCAICNGETIALLPGENFCAGDTSQFDRSHSFLLAYSLKMETTHSIKNCGLTKLYDPITNMCQNVHCSFPLRLNWYSMECMDGLQFTMMGFIILPMRIIYKVPVNISYVQLLSTVVKEILNKKQVFVCKMMIYSKTEIPLWKWRILSETQKKNIFVAENVIIVDFYPKYNVTLPFAILNDIKSSIIFQHNDSINKIEFETMVGNLDTWMLITENDPSAFIDGIGGPKKRNENGKFLYEDPYSKHVVIGHLDVSYDRCYRTNIPVLFAKEFMKCPSFLYDIDRHGITRYSRGLLLTSMNVTFDFGTFQSKNESHVYICTDSVRSHLASSACSIIYSSTNLLSFVVYIALIFNRI